MYQIKTSRIFQPTFW